MTFTANGLVRIAVRQEQDFLANIPSWADQIVGGWNVRAVARYRSGTSHNNFEQRILSDQLPEQRARDRCSRATVNYSTGYGESGSPSMFRSTTAASSFTGQYAGTTGTRAIVRLAGFKNFDIAASKVFHLPWEGHQVRFRAEAFNAFNNVNFYNPVLRLDRTSTFGEYQNASPSRVMQFALRYEF